MHASLFPFRSLAPLLGLPSLLLGANLPSPSAVDSLWQVTWHTSFALSSTRLVSSERLHRPIVDAYPGPNWYGAHLDPEAARSWDSLPPAAQLQVQVQRGNFSAFTQIPVHRDAESWMVDPWHTNLPWGPAQLDINVPYRGWADWKSESFQTRLGRFSVDSLFDPSGVILAGTPHHDGLWWKWGKPSWSYTFLWSSLNPWLHGTPDDSSLQPPVGSENWQQSHLTISNQRNRIYNEPYKNLLVHRLAFHRPRYSLAIVEMVLIGGKALDLRDANPFVVWHNNYGDGYSKSATGLEAQIRHPNWGQTSAQILIQDIRSGVGEQLGVDHRVIGAAHLGWRQTWGLWLASTAFNITTPTFDTHRLPLLRFQSRRIYRSNHRLQVEPNFVDNFVADYPLDYTRGGDCVDLLGYIERNIPSAHLRTGLDLRWLQRGDARTYPTFDSMEDLALPLGGTVEREAVALSSWQWTPPSPWSLRLQAGVSYLDNPNHQRKSALWSPLWNLQLAWMR